MSTTYYLHGTSTGPVEIGNTSLMRYLLTIENISNTENQNSAPYRWDVTIHKYHDYVYMVFMEHEK